MAVSSSTAHDWLRILACVIALFTPLYVAADDAPPPEGEDASAAEITVETSAESVAEPAAGSTPSFHEAYVPGTIMQFTPEYTLIVRKKVARLDAPVTVGDSAPISEAISVLEFLDGEGRPLYEQRFPLRMDDTGFINPCVLDLSQRTLAGRPFLQLEYGCDPTTPGFHNYRFFALDTQRQLRQVASPLDGINGKIITPVTAVPHRKPLHVRLWTGYYDLVIPFVFDAAQHALVVDYGKQRYLAIEQYQPAQLQLRPEGNSAVLHDKPGGNITGTVQASAGSRVKYLRAYANGELVTDGELPWVGEIGAVKWLEIDIDGKRGWINLEHAAQLGLPGSG